MQKKHSKTKVKAFMAMVAFVAVAIMMVSSTMIGVVGYATQVASAQPNSQTAVARSPIGIAAIAPGISALSEK